MVSIFLCHCKFIFVHTAWSISTSNSKKKLIKRQLNFGLLNYLGPYSVCLHMCNSREVMATCTGFKGMHLSLQIKCMLLKQKSVCIIILGSVCVLYCNTLHEGLICSKTREILPHVSFCQEQVVFTAAHMLHYWFYELIKYIYSGIFVIHLVGAVMFLKKQLHTHYTHTQAQMKELR